MPSLKAFFYFCILLIIRSHLAILSGYSWLCTQQLHLAVPGEPYGNSGQPRARQMSSLLDCCSYPDFSYTRASRSAGGQLAPETWLWDLESHCPKSKVCSAVPETGAYFRLQLGKWDLGGAHPAEVCGGHRKGQRDDPLTGGPEMAPR